MNGMQRYPVAKPGVFRTVQGEGALLGVPMVFVRLAGCSVGCAQCDTDYGIAERLTAEEIAARVRAVRPASGWIWVTGGEPADHNLWSLFEELRLCGRIAVATAGTKGFRGVGNMIDFLSVSPHGTPAELVLTRGSQVNLVPGLNGLRLAAWADFDFSGFRHHYVTPVYGSAASLAECLEWAESHDGWRLGVQAHKQWGLP